MTLAELLKVAEDSKASDVHITVGVPPLMRVHGKMMPIPNEPRLMAEDVEALVKGIMGEFQKRAFAERGEIDFSFGLAGMGRYRVNVFRQRGTTAAVFRLVGSKIPNPHDLGVPQPVIDLYEMKSGLVLVTGPTGSGKSTTCYTVLNELNRPEVNIITVEDPVEANVPGINQVQVNVKAGLTFASALRSILRQDPDIIMIGEIRDGETAQIAVQASITGHLVVSTLHTNSTAASITRLIDMGVEPYMIGDAVVGIIAQRLVRRLCPSCKVPHEATAQEKVLLDYPQDKPLTIYDPGGCDKCGNGYKGRRAIYEIMPISAAIRRTLHDTVTAEIIQNAAVSEGMNTLQMAGARNVIDGVTSIAEMMRVAYDMDAQTAANTMGISEESSEE